MATWLLQSNSNYLSSHFGNVVINSTAIEYFFTTDRSNVDHPIVVNFKVVIRKNNYLIGE